MSRPAGSGPVAGHVPTMRLAAANATHREMRERLLDYTPCLGRYCTASARWAASALARILAEGSLVRVSARFRSQRGCLCGRADAFIHPVSVGSTRAPVQSVSISLRTAGTDSSCYHSKPPRGSRVGSLLLFPQVKFLRAPIDAI